MSALLTIAERHKISPALRVLRRAFSFPVAAAALLAGLAVLTVRGRFDDPDMWWHLKNGEVIWTTHAIPVTDLFSYTTSHHAIVPQEWLSELLIYGAYHLGGYTGLMLWLCLFSSALLIAGYILCSVYSGNAKVGFAGAMLVWFFATVGLAVRGQMIGYLLLIFELLLLHLGRTRSPGWFFALPVLMTLWVNCHGSFIFGLIVMAVFLFCSFLDLREGGLICERVDARQRRALIIAVALSCMAVFLNPDGAKQVLYPLNTMLHEHIVVTQISEWQPLAISDSRGAGLLAILAFIALCLIVRQTARIYLHEALLLALGAWLALSHQRMAFVFGILAAPVVTRLLSGAWEGYEPEKDRILPNAALIALSFLVIYAMFPSRAALTQQVEDGSPVKAAVYVRAHRLTGNMLNTFGDGGYLIWALPQHPVFIDGRADAYEATGVLAEFGNWAMLQSDPVALLDKYHINFCLLDRDAPMSRVLPLLPGWKQVYSDAQSVIFLRSAASD